MSAVMPRQLRSDLVKAMSAPTLITLSSLVIVVPVLIVFMTGLIDRLRFDDAATATQTLLAIGVSGALGCAFYGSYLVTRDEYYRGMDRNFLMAPASIVFASRVIVAAIVGAGLAIVGFLVWSVVTGFILADRGASFVFSPEVAALALGDVVAGAVAAVIGCSVGWVVRNYYVTVVVLLVLPAMVAPLMLDRARDVERFLPVGAVAGLGGVQLDGLLGQVTAGLVLVGWAALFVAVAWLVLRRRVNA
ncbi:hypothetical protein [Microbacterium sp. 179-I 3D3 NHS]|uniref:hypothetical protein n=1 Tax=unclassified Microbacterium TaxID=2609290 RepID=UPI0039A248FE